MVKEKVLDYQAVIDSPVPLNVIASSLDQRKSVIFNKFSGRDDLFQALKASSCIPLVAGQPVIINGERFWDASLYQSIPLNAAVEDGCTHVLVLRTRPEGVLRGEPGFLEKNLFAGQIRRMEKVLADDFLLRAQEYKNVLDTIDESEINPEKPPYLLSVKLPAGTKPVHNLEKRAAVLIRGAQDGIKATYKLLGIPIEGVAQLVYPFRPDGKICKY
jgi:predicted patatin/cPLA2 family phospholipase